MFSKKSALLGSLLLVVASQAQATLILNRTVTSSFQSGISSTGTHGNDVPGHPLTLYFGQLGATANGYVDFYYIGNEAGYTNTFHAGPSGSGIDVSTASRPDNFSSRLILGSLAVTAGSILDFSFCTNGGDSFGATGRCVENDSTTSLIQQFNHGNVGGYRSTAFAAASGCGPSGTVSYISDNPSTSNCWRAFFDDSGARNDDNHDDIVIDFLFRPEVVTRVPEPGTLGLAFMGLAGLTMARRRIAAKAAR